MVKQAVFVVTDVDHHRRVFGRDKHPEAKHDPQQSLSKTLQQFFSKICLRFENEL